MLWIRMVGQQCMQLLSMVGWVVSKHCSNGREELMIQTIMATLQVSEPSFDSFQYGSNFDSEYNHNSIYFIPNHVSVNIYFSVIF